ncbi:hypothetical protein [Methylobacterium sp. NEAU K]|uniref:hypothetical protein n=1 Tax=Methylobacterium sp. NEAU K TaxID=3064946 RepID=UPI0027338010|nr:hypothetical protein [Methylobacterium sp. NEAU K]MDP4005093.1 hypothetical protein [Methylobacterium sp. NEAU K]
MTWLLLQSGRALFRGTYGDALDAAESMRVCERAFHPDGSELTPRLDRGVMLVPAQMLPSVRRRAAA